jgi:hypothetical protein
MKVLISKQQLNRLKKFISENKVIPKKNITDNIDECGCDEKEKPTLKKKVKLNEKCWKGYKQVGMKTKRGKSVPNCVPVNENKINKTKIKIKSIPKHSYPSDKMFLDKLCLLRTASKVGDIEVVNNTQLSKLKDNDVDFEKLTLNESLTELNESDSRYMFFTNLEQIKQQCNELLSLSKDEVENMLNDGHDWAADHLATAKESIDQVYEFFTNENNTSDMNELMEQRKPMVLKKKVNISEELKYHINNKINLYESVLRYGSEKYIDLLIECKKLINENILSVNEIDKEILENFNETPIILEGKKLYEGIIYEDNEIDDYEILNESVKNGKRVKLNKPKRGGSKKFYVYVKNPKTKKIKKVSFGAAGGGRNLSVKLKDPKAKANFAKRHKCSEKTDKTTPGYWSCRLPRYAKQLNLSSSGTGYW